MTDHPSHQHPAPHRHRASPGLLLFAISGAGIAWLAQLIIDYALAAHRCYPHDVPATGGIADWLRVTLAGLNIAAVIVALAAGLAARRIWLQTRGEREGASDELIDAGEGRTRFVAMCGQLAAIGFLVAIAFDTIAVFSVPTCSG
jgi:uncharacterized membrane protein YbhN (UPF0104 family)